MWLQRIKVTLAVTSAVAITLYSIVVIIEFSIWLAEHFPEMF